MNRTIKERLIKNERELLQYDYVTSYGGPLYEESFYDGDVTLLLFHPKCKKDSDVITQIYKNDITTICPCCGKREVIHREYILYYIPRRIVEERREEMIKQIRNNRLDNI